MHRSLARLSLAVALGACPAPPPSPRAPTSRAFVRVELQVSNLEVGPPDHLAIDFDGAMRLVRVAGLPPAGIGLFATRLRPDELRALTRSLQDVASLPDHWGRIVPDDRVRRVLVTWAGAPAVEKAVGTTEPVDPRLASILDRLEALMRRTGEHPRQTIGLMLGEVALGPGRTLVGTAQLTATGTAAVQAPSLVALLGDPGALGLRLEGAHDRTEIPILDVLGPQGPRIRLEPGLDTTLFMLTAAPPPTPTFERASLVVRWDGAGADAPIAGELSSPAVPITTLASPALSLAWPERVCVRGSASSPVLQVHAAGCNERLWCEVRRDGPDPVLVIWADSLRGLACSSAVPEVGACAQGGPFAPTRATIRINDTISVPLETDASGALEPGRCWDVPRLPATTPAELAAIATRLAPPRPTP